MHIADDSSHQDHNSHIEPLLRTCEDYGVEHVSSTCSDAKGYGANYNAAMQVVHGSNSDYVLPLEDDWELVKDLNIEPILSVLDTGFAGCVRLGYLGYTQPLAGMFFTYADKHWIRLDKLSPEPHVFAGHPRVETVAWEREVGPWQVGLTPGETEWEVAHRKAARNNVVWPISLTRPEGDLYVHIGTVQSTER